MMFNKLKQKLQFESELDVVSEKYTFLVVLTLNVNEKQKNKKLYSLVYKIFKKSIKVYTIFKKVYKNLKKKVHFCALKCMKSSPGIIIVDRSDKIFSES